MKILYVCRTFPYPEDEGEKVRESSVLKLLTKGNDIHLLILSKENIIITNDLNKFVSSINFIKIENRFKRLTLLPKNVAYYQNNKTKGKIKEFLSQRKFDLMYIRSTYLLPYFANIKIYKNKKIYKIAELTDSNKLYFKRKIKEQKNLLDKLKILILFLKTIRYESKITKQFDRVVLISKHDKNLIKVDDRNKIKIVTNYIPTLFFKKSKIKEKKELIFFGSFHFDENKKAVDYFMGNIFNKLQKEIEDIKLVLVGKGSEQYKNMRGIIAKGYVSNLKEELDSAKIFICPLINGGGVKMKVIHAMAAGKAIITTPIGVEGIPAKHNKHMMIARNPEQFAECVIKLLKSNNLRKKLGNEARKLAEKEYSKEGVQKQMDELLAQFNMKYKN